MGSGGSDQRYPYARRATSLSRIGGQKGNRGRQPEAVTKLKLAPRMLLALRLLAAGKDNAEIAKELGVSLNTAKTHLLRLYERLGATGRAHAVAIGYQQGYLTVPSPQATSVPPLRSASCLSLRDGGPPTDAALTQTPRQQSPAGRALASGDRQ